MGALAIAIALAAIPSPLTIRVARTIAIAAVVCAFFGIYEHVKSNYDLAPLDYRYTDRWPTMSSWSRWWAAANKSVGPSPPLAPAVLLYGSLCVLFATIRHPVLRGLDRRPSRERCGENPVKTIDERVQLLEGCVMTRSVNTPRALAS